MVFLLLRELTRSAILWSQKLDSTNWRAMLVHGVKENLVISRQICVYHCILLLKHLPNHVCIFKQTISNDFHGPTRPIQGTDPRHSVPLMKQR